MKKRFLMFLAGVILVTSIVAGDAFEYMLMFDGTSADYTPYAFGRVNGALDTLDDFDFPIPMGTPNSMGINHIQFRSLLGVDEDPFLANSWKILSHDYRSTENSATTWTFDVLVSSATVLRWETEAGKALDNANASLVLITPNGTTCDMKANSSVSVPVSGTYSIKYKESANVVEAPDSFPLIEAKMAVYEGGSISFKVIDPSKYEFAGDPSCTIAFFKGEGRARERVKASETDGLVSDSATGCITYTFDTTLGFDEVVITYCFCKKTPQTRDGDNTAVAYGSLRAVDVKTPIIQMESDANLSVDVKSEEAGANSCKLSYKLIFPSAGENGRLIDETNTLVLYPTITVPALFSVVPPEGMGVDGIKENADGSHSITYSYEATSNGFTLDFILTAEEGAKKGNASLQVTCDFPNDSTKVKLPEDADIATTTATISVKGSGNLSVDGDEYINYKDTYLIGYFIDQLANVPDIYETPEDIPVEDILGHLAGEYTPAQAKEIKDNLIALAAAGMLDITGDGYTNYIDQYLIGYFIDQLANVPDIYETPADIPVEDILGHLAGEFTAEQGEQIKQRLLDLVP